MAVTPSCVSVDPSLPKIVGTLPSTDKAILLFFQPTPGTTGCKYNSDSGVECHSIWEQRPGDLTAQAVRFANAVFAGGGPGVGHRGSLVCMRSGASTGLRHQRATLFHQSRLVFEPLVFENVKQVSKISCWFSKNNCGAQDRPAEFLVFSSWKTDNLFREVVASKKKQCTRCHPS